MSFSLDKSYKISVVIPAYNAAAYLDRALASVLSQTTPAHEIIVVDDGSTDQTADLVQNYGAPIKYISQPHAGASAARNTGIAHACYDWIAFLDADDEWLTHHLETQTSLLRHNPHLVWSTANFLRCSCDATPPKPDIDPSRADHLLAGCQSSNNYFSAFLTQTVGCTITTVIYKPILRELGGFQVGLARINDMDMWFRIAYRYPQIGYASQPSAIYHLAVPGSIIKTHTNPQFIYDFIDRHLILAQQHGLLDHFTPCATLMVGYWFKSLLHQGRGTDARHLLLRYRRFFSSYFITTAFISSHFPRSALAYHRLKSKITRPPQSSPAPPAFYTTKICTAAKPADQLKP